MINKKHAIGSINLLFAFISVLLSLIAGCGKKAPEPTQPQAGADLEGKWVGSEVNGRAGEWIFVISENQLAGTGPNEEWYKGTLSLDSKTTPKQANFVIADCFEQDFVGKTALGIYKLEANTLTLAASRPGATTRPASFEAGAPRVWVLTKK